MIGMLHLPSQSPKDGVVIVVGGPQYRVGSHRQFLLLARDLAASGIAAFRFDCRGMGDSDGAFPGFESLDRDIASAIDAMLRAAPSIARVTLWGLCDAASAICGYAHQDRRIKGVVLVNPWVRTEAGQARTYLKHYYRQRLLDPSFWSSVLTRQFDAVASARSLLGNLVRAFGAKRADGEPGAGNASLAERMAIGLEGFDGPVLLIISGRDLTAKEFEDVARGSSRWRRIFAAPRLMRRELVDADHTFSRRIWRDTIAEWTREWIVERVAIRRG